jgi:hypothetical protein
MDRRIDLPLFTKACVSACCSHYTIVAVMRSKITAIVIEKISPMELAGLAEQKANHLVMLN